MNGLFQSRDGTPIYYESRGQGRPLVLCYGLLCRRDHWKHQISHFAKRYRIIQLDYRGHQRSATPSNEQNLTLEWCAKDVQDLLDFLELEEAACVGHSLGVPILSHLAVLEPKRLKANVFVCGGVNNPFEQMLFTNKLDAVFDWSNRLYEALPPLGEMIWRRVTGARAISHFIAMQLGFNPQVARDEDVEGYMQGVRETRPEIFYRLMQDYRRLDRRPLLKQSEVPTLVVAGEQDCITPMTVQEEITRLLPKGELERVPGGSHNAHMDFPEVVNGRISMFLERLGYV